MKNNEDGYIVVETVGCFTLFVLLMASILSLINIVVVQARMHYALTQTAETVSMYCYALEKIGFAKPLMGISDSADKTQKEIDTFKGNLSGVINTLSSIGTSKDYNDVYESGNDLYEYGKGIYDQGQKLAEMEPKEILQKFLNYSLDQIESVGFKMVLQALMGRYLSNGQTSGNDYLLTHGVIDGTKGLDFASIDLFDIESRGNSNSRILTGEGNVRIIVTYKIKYAFGALPLPFSELKITQQVETKAWLNGNQEKN